MQTACMNEINYAKRELNARRTAGSITCNLMQRKLIMDGFMNVRKYDYGLWHNDNSLRIKLLISTPDNDM